MGFFNNLFGNNDKKNADDNSNLSGTTFSKFVNTYKPSTDLTKPTQEMLEWYADKLPKELLRFWTEHGFGNYGDGLIKVVEPSEYMDSFYTWIGKEDDSKLPILVTAFGDIFYYRKLSDTEGDVSLLDIHYRNIEVCDYTLENFFEKYMVDPELSKELLKKSLFDQAVKKLGRLTYPDIYFFKPALVLGGAENTDYLDKGNASVHQLILHQLGQ
jgi:hypothetical protein